MLIDHKKEFVFVAVPKTASTTIQTFFNRQRKLYPQKHPFFQEKHHYSYRWILNDHPEATRYFSFGFARNPWDRMVSSWIEFTSKRTNLVAWDKALVDEFRDFTDFALHLGQSTWAHEIHFQPASWYLGCATEQVDFIGKYESLNADFNAIVARLNMPEANITEHPKRRRTKRDPDYRKYYTNDKMIESVGALFQDDITNFGYAF